MSDTGRKRPPCTKLVQEHIEAFFAQIETETGSGLPDFVKDEFDAFLECGVLAHGFLRLRCADCPYEKLVAFSCKRRGILAFVRWAAHGADGYSPGRSRYSQCSRSAMSALTTDSAEDAICCPSASAFTRIAGHFARHLHFSDQTGWIQAA